METISKITGSINEWISLYILIFWVFTCSQDWRYLYISIDLRMMELKVVEKRKTEYEKITT